MRASATALGRLARWIWPAAGALLLAAVGGAAFLIAQARSSAMTEGDDRLRSLVAAAEADTNRTLATVDLKLASLSKLLGPVAASGGFDVEQAQALLADLQERQLIFSDLTLVDESGQTVTSSLRALRRSNADLPPGFYQAVFASPIPTLAVFGPVRGRASGERSLLLARRIAIEGAPPRLGRMPGGCPFQPRCPRAEDVCAEMPAFTVEPDRRFACWRPR